MEAIYSGYDSGDEKIRQAGTVGEKKVCRTRDDRGGTNQDCFAELYFVCVRFELAKQLNLS